MTDFVEFRKIPRLSREIIITEKIDGTNGVIFNGDDGEFLVGSKFRWITPENDNFGFAKWAYEHKEELQTLGPGYHFGEWWGQGIQRNYGLKEKRFSLFNLGKWTDRLFVKRWGGDMASSFPSCCCVVPIINHGDFCDSTISSAMLYLQAHGSIASTGFMKPEGIVIFHTQSGYLFKKTFENDDAGKGKDNQ